MFSVVEGMDVLANDLSRFMPFACDHQNIVRCQTGDRSADRLSPVADFLYSDPYAELTRFALGGWWRTR